MQLSSLARFSLWLLISTVVAPAFTGTPSSAQPAIAQPESQPESQPVSMPIGQQNDETSTPKPRRSYIGVGATIGLSDPDETGLGEGGFSIISRAGFTENLGLHTVSIFSDTFTGNLALTVRLPVKSGESARTLFEPFIGPGISIQDGEIGALVSTGADVPLTKDMTATARLNIGFPNDNTEVGIIFGLGYNFGLF